MNRLAPTSREIKSRFMKRQPEEKRERKKEEKIERKGKKENT